MDARRPADSRGLSNFICFVERDATQFMPPSTNDPRQDDYDIWLGTLIFEPWIATTRHSGAANYLYLDGHVETQMFGNCVQNMFPTGSCSRRTERTPTEEFILPPS